MVALSLQKGLLTLIVVGLILAANVRGDCSSCAANECCSKYDFCGTTAEYCGDGCKSGPCTTTTNGISVPDIVTEDFFNGILNQAQGNCPGKSFYTRAAFLDALNSYNQFAKSGSNDDGKREIAAFFAHVTHETTSLCYIEEKDVPTTENYCDDINYPKYPCNPSKRYIGRGPLQLTWNYNYGPAGSEIGFDGLGSPETVANDANISFKTALWYWTNSVRQYVSQGFGRTIRAINPNECDGKEPAKVQSRIQYYQQYCTQLGVAPGDNLSC